MTRRSNFARPFRIAAQGALGMACGFALFPVAAHAEEVEAKTPVAVAKPVSMDRRVCLRDVPTGTRIAREFCQTRGEWIRDTGIDPIAPR